MATNQIPLNPSNIQANAVLAYRNQLISFLAQKAALQRAGTVVLEKLASMVDGSDYTALETQLGGLTPGMGLILFNQANSVVGNTADGTQTQGAVAAAMDQFIGWVG